MPTDQNPKQLVAQRVKDASNILVTVSRNPSVDELAAALALTLILDKMGKTPTAVFSGEIPKAIEFLEPGKTFDTNVDGLRDFIIALDKEKADRLRYKVEGDVVRVFITPYRTTITDKDLTFSQGDFNVELIVAIGVEKREDLDTAITAHGRILHDATIVTVNNRPGVSVLGEVDWSDVEASSVSEMLMSLTESLQPGVLDEPIATAILTGLVSATDRFRNNRTTPKVMTMSAQLMAAGANQQLIAEKLEEAEGVQIANVNSANGQTSTARVDGEMKVEHEEPNESKKENSEPVAPRTLESELEKKANELADKHSSEAVAEANKRLSEIPETHQVDSRVSEAKVSSWRDAPMPSTGGSLSATAEQAVEDKIQAENNDKNRVILSHDSAPVDGVAVVSPIPPALNASSLPATEPEVKDVFADGPTDSTATVAPQTVMQSGIQGMQFEETPLGTPAAPVVPAAPTAPINPTLDDLKAEVDKQAETTAPAEVVDDARAAVNAVFEAQPFDPAGQPLASVGAQPLGEISHDSPAQSMAPLATSPVTAAGLPPLPPLPPLPDFSTLPPLPGAQPVQTSTQSQDQPQQPAAAPPTFGLPEQQNTSSTSPMFPAGTPDPGEFQLPGQQ